MPHICTRCNNIFDSGEDILRGCPVCGWKKFMFVKKVQHEREQHAEQVINKSMGVRRPPKRSIKERSVEESVENSVKKIKVGTGELAQSAHERPQSSHERLQSAHEKPPVKPVVKPVRAKIDDKIADTTTQDKNTTPSPQINDKLESIKITAPGTYELNLPSLFERDELIMAVKEGTYFIDLSSAFRKGKKE